MHVMFRTTMPSTLILALLVAGCNPTAKSIIGGKPRPKDYHAIVSLSPGTSELFGDMIILDKVKGRTSSCNWPGQTRGVPIVAGVKPDYERIAKIPPDLIVYDKDLYSEADVAKIKQLCDDQFVLDANNLQDYMTQATLLAAKVGGETQMSSYLDRVFQAQRSAQANAQAKRPKVALIMPGEGSEHMVDGVDSFQADEIKASGGEPVGPKGTRFVTLSPETLVQLDPDFIMTAGDPATFLKDTRFTNLRAVKTGHVFGINSDIVLRRGGRVDIFISNVAKVLQGHVVG